MRAKPILALLVLLPVVAASAVAEESPEVAQMRGPGFGCAAPFLLHAADEAAREVMSAEPPPFRRAMLTCLAQPGARKRPLHAT